METAKLYITQNKGERLWFRNQKIDCTDEERIPQYYDLKISQSTELLCILSKMSAFHLDFFVLIILQSHSVLFLLLLSNHICYSYHNI
jgi:hypothetical protein